MPRNQKTVEKELVGEFLNRCFGLTVCRLSARMPPHPDIRAVIKRNAGNSILEIELTKYHVDSSPEVNYGSPGARLDGFWWSTYRSLMRRLPRKHFRPLQISVTLKTPMSSAPSPRLFAAELSQFVRQFRFQYDYSKSAWVGADNRLPALPSWIAKQRGFDEVHQFPPSFPLLIRHSKGIRVRRVEYDGPSWSCQNISATGVGLNIPHLVELIKKKNSKAYTVGHDSSKLLLIHASGSPIVSAIGPCPTPARWKDRRLEAVCASSHFHHIYVWERGRDWRKCLKGGL
jgi:hypothetical protein